MDSFCFLTDFGSSFGENRLNTRCDFVENNPADFRMLQKVCAYVWMYKISLRLLTGRNFHRISMNRLESKKVPFEYRPCSKKVPFKYKQCSKNVPFKYRLCSKKIPLKYKLCSRKVPLKYKLFQKSPF